MLRRVVVAIAILFSTGATFAADIPVKAPVLKVQPDPPYRWDGFYVGANVGYGFGAQNGTLVNSSQDSITLTGIAVGQTPTRFDTSTHGPFGGAQVGYNFRSGRYVFGAETDLQLSGMRGTGRYSFPGATVAGPFPGFPGVASVFFVPSTFTGEERLTTFGTVRARVGFLPVERLLVYATGGFAYGHFVSNYMQTGFPPAPAAPVSASFARKEWRPGWTAGAGGEYKLTPNLSVKAEYLYLDFGTTDQFFVQTGFVEYHFRHQEHIGRVGLNWAFAR